MTTGKRDADSLAGRVLNSFDNPEEVADMLTGEEITASLAYNAERGNLAAVAALEDELQQRRESASGPAGRSR